MEPRRLPLPEFVAMMALLFAMVAFSIDAMLPAFPTIAAELTPDAPNRAQLILSFFIAGMGLGTLVAGPVSDRFGRLPVIYGGIVIFIAGALLSYVAPTLETLLAARVLQGLGAAAPRVVALALVRDLYEGRRMAQITSFIMTVFILVPAAAPWIGQQVIDAWGWRAIFLAFTGFALVAGLWLRLRQDETLPAARRRPLAAGPLWSSLKEVLGNRLVLIYIAVMTLGFGQMFALLSSTQQIYDITFGRGASFPEWFMLTALLSALGTVLNATLVMRIGMRRMALSAYAVQAAISVVLVIAWFGGMIPAAAQFWVFLGWSISVFLMPGLTFGNLNALALQPLGHIAGLAASAIAAVSTVASVLLAAPISLAFDGTPRPVLAGTLLCSALAFLLMLRTTERTPPAAG